MARVADERPSGATRVARGERVDAFPNWDPDRRALILHSDRDAGSSYDGALDGPVEHDAAQEPRRPARRRSRRPG